MVSRLGYLAVISWTINKWASHLKANSLKVFFANDKMWAFKRKFEFWKICTHHHKLDSFWILKDISEKLNGDVNKCDLKKTILHNEACMSMI